MSSEPTAAVPGGGGASGQGRPLTWRDVQGGTRRRADELISTEAEAAALHALRTATEETDGDMERHAVRQYLIAERLADTGGVAYDRELLLCASFLHDAGLYGREHGGHAHQGLRALRPSNARTVPLAGGRLRRRLRAAPRLHHAMSMGNEVELVRRSDLPELMRFGIYRSWLTRELWHAAPRAGLWAATCDVFRAHWRRMLPGMFRPPAAQRHSEPSSSWPWCPRPGRRAAGHLRCPRGPVLS